MVSEPHLWRVRSPCEAEGREAQAQRDRIRADMPGIAQEGQRTAPDASGGFHEGRRDGDPESCSETALQPKAGAMGVCCHPKGRTARSEEHTSELQSPM